MAANAFDTEITETAEALIGPWRQPRQMLHAQVYDAHASIHDDATAQKLGFKGGTIEGPTHFSQFAPLGARLWGQAWFESGCLSAHYRNACFEGEDVQAILSKPLPGTSQCQIQMVKRDGTEVLRGIGFGRRSPCSDRAGDAPDRAQAARRSRDPARREGGADEQAAGGADGVRPEHGRPLSVLAAAEARGHHRELALLFRRRQSVGSSPSFRWRC